jgi:nucleoside-diphosphate-sugar epimerase
VTTVAVTGASGFVGGAVCRAALAAGLQVRAYGRRPSVPAAHVGGAAYRAWDVAAGPLEGAEPVDAVVHCAATLTDWARIADLWPVNVGGTANVLASFPAPARFVQVSSASVYDLRRPTVAATEDQALGPRGRHLSAYGATKAAAEALVLGRPGSVVLRPRAVYGPGDPTLLPRLLAAAERPGGLVLPGGGVHLTSLTSVGNLAAACLLAATGAAASGGVFNVSDAEPVVLVEALRELLAACGRPVRIRAVPARLAGAVAAAAEGAWRLARRPGPPPLTRYAVAQLACERTLDIGAARTGLGYRPAPTSLAGAGAWSPAGPASLPT